MYTNVLGIERESQVGCQPPNMVCQQWHVEAEGEPLCCTEEHHAEEDMDEVLREHKLKRAEEEHIRSYTDRTVQRAFMVAMVN